MQTAIRLTAAAFREPGARLEFGAKGGSIRTAAERHVCVSLALTWPHSRPKTSQASLSAMSGQRNLVAELSTLRSIVGSDAKEGDLLNLLERHQGNVQAAVSEFFDGPAAPPTAVARPADTPPPADEQIVQVVCPAGAGPGVMLQVQTHAGAMHVTIPQGVGPGQTFLVRCPPSAQAPGAQVPGYPGLQNQPTVVVARRQPAVHVVHSRPYYGPYPYRGYYGGTALGVGAGLLGGMLIADAMFW